MMGIHAKDERADGRQEGRTKNGLIWRTNGRTTEVAGIADISRALYRKRLRRRIDMMFTTIERSINKEFEKEERTRDQRIEQREVKDEGQREAERSLIERARWRGSGGKKEEE